MIQVRERSRIYLSIYWHAKLRTLQRSGWRNDQCNGHKTKPLIYARDRDCLHISRPGQDIAMPTANRCWGTRHQAPGTWHSALHGSLASVDKPTNVIAYVDSTCWSSVWVRASSSAARNSLLPNEKQTLTHTCINILKAKCNAKVIYAWFTWGNPRIDH